jgi:hypothetical protein
LGATEAFERKRYLTQFPQINTLPTSSLKTSLLNKVTQLQNLVGITKSLASMTATVTKKGAKGAIPDTDVQNILSILDNINNVL